MPRPRSLRAPFLCALLLATACEDAPTGGPGTEAFVGERLTLLLGPCERPDPFTADVADLIPVLVSKLATAESDVASRARADLIAAGSAGLPELRRAFQRSFSEPGHAPRLLVLLDLAALAGGPEARAMGLEGLEHPSESVRSAAMRALEAAGTPADYDRIARNTSLGGEELAQRGVRALAACDPARAARELASWFDDRGLARIADLGAQYLARHMDAPTRASLLADARLAPVARTWLLAASAAAGDEEARRLLRAALTDERSIQRQVAIQAAIASDLVAEVRACAANDPDPTLRVVALEAIAAEPDAPERRAELTAALADPEETVRQVALTALCTRGDAAAIDAAIELCAGTNDDLGRGMRALRAALALDPAVARRLLARLEELLSGGMRSTGYAIERAIGQVPLARAAEILVTAARTSRGTIQEIPAHRWYLVQAGNTGAEGRAWIRSQWDEELDPTRRIDLISAGVQEQSPAAMEFLERVLESPRATDLERLHAADLLARSAPAARAAPVLKRTATRIRDPQVQRALNCLLWRFYGPERERG